MNNYFILIKKNMVQLNELHRLFVIQKIIMEMVGINQQQQQQQDNRKQWQISVN